MPKNLLQVGALVLGTVVMLSLFERNLIFFPTVYPAGRCAAARPVTRVSGAHTIQFQWRSGRLGSRSISWRVA